MATIAVAGQRTIATAQCEATGIRISYSDGGSSLVGLDAADGQSCEDVRISPDRKHVGWVRLWDEVESRDSLGRVKRHLSSDLFVDGRAVSDAPAGLYDPGWRFSSDGTKVLFCAGPLHGGCTFCLYDVEANQPLKVCDPRQEPGECMDWDRLFEAENPVVDTARLSGKRP